MSSLPCSVGISELIKVWVLVINVLWEETCGKETQAQEGLGQTAERVRGGDYSLPVLVSLCHPDDEDSLKGQTPHLCWWLRINQKHRQMHQRTGWTMSYWLGLLAAQIKSWVTAIGGRWSVVISRPRCQEALLCESCISLQTTHTLTFALRSARKEIPEAHFQFMQNHHGKPDSFHFN